MRAAVDSDTNSTTRESRQVGIIFLFFFRAREDFEYVITVLGYRRTLLPRGLVLGTDKMISCGNRLRPLFSLQAPKGFHGQASAKRDDIFFSFLVHFTCIGSTTITTTTA